MIPASLYTPLYYQAMLLVIFGSAVVYLRNQANPQKCVRFNQWATLFIGISLVVFIGFRPVSGIYFVDMGDYAKAYEHVQGGAEAVYPDRLFNGLMHLCSPILPVVGFFVVCALLYIAPLAIAFWRIHRTWAFPVFLGSLTALSFWGYGVNGIRSGIAASVLTLAFAFHERLLIMLPLMAASWGFHGAIILPAAAFLLVRYLRWTEIWVVFWLGCVVTSLLVGNLGEMLLSRFNPLVWDNRVEAYILGSETGGFRADFLLYSIVPVLLTLFFGGPTDARDRGLIPRTSRGRRSNVVWKPEALLPMRTQIGSLLYLQRPSVVLGGSCALVDKHPSELQGDQNSFWRKRRCQSLRPKPQAEHKGWRSLPWCRLLRSDPFYARLVNTYLLANGLWVLVIHANFSNRFAYLSWFMMPWVLVYPFIPGKVVREPRLGLLTATLCAQYLFTYIMGVVVYPLRGMQ